MTNASEPAVRTSIDGPAPKGIRRHGPNGRPGASARLLALLFLGPALFMLLVLVAYPIVHTVWLSLHNADGSRFVGIENYLSMFTAPETRRAILNNAIWVVVAPSAVTAVGLVCAVLTEKVKLGTAFKTVLFMPMAISFLAAGVTFRLVYDENPDRGVLNAVMVGAHDAFAEPSLYHGVTPRTDAPLSQVDGAIVTTSPIVAGTPALIPLLGLPADRIPSIARPAALPQNTSGITGVVWLDFTRGGGGKAGTPDPTESGLPDMVVQALRDGKVVATTTTDGSGRFAFPDLPSGEYQIRLDAANFTEPFAGATWL
ncbi:MAG TPA: ABC transporter permease, partial [Micromonosporaceae bacterium]|nr:ABC transporter permease [Micromonosporaceae bacterium]